MGLLKRIFWDADVDELGYDESLSPDLAKSIKDIESKINNYNQDTLTAIEKKQSIFAENLKTEKNKNKDLQKEKDDKEDKDEERIY